VNKKRGLLFDRCVVLTNYYQSRYSPKELRLVGFKDPGTKKKIVFMTNNFSLSAYTIARGSIAVAIVQGGSCKMHSEICPETE